MNGHDDESTWVEHTLVRLGESQFRAKFVLSEADRSYARDKGRHVIDRHAHEMLRARVGEAQPSNDGRQTPWRGHPVFTAQHATATCCRGCIEKWHHLPKGREQTGRSRHGLDRQGSDESSGPGRSCRRPFCTG